MDRSFLRRVGGIPNSLSSIHNLGTSLEELRLYGWETLTQLPHQFQYLTALRSLSIWDFHAVKALPEWLGNLSSLQDLWIVDCKNLKYLPSERFNASPN
ncbi:hypothetical protein SLA2020_189970 [Shorea laevis]